MVLHKHKPWDSGDKWVPAICILLYNISCDMGLGWFPVAVPITHTYTVGHASGIQQCGWHAHKRGGSAGAMLVAPVHAVTSLHLFQSV